MKTIRTLARCAGLAGLLVLPPVAGAAADDRFHGGSFDGAARGSFLGFTPPIPGAYARFVGGGTGHDGYAAGSYQSYTTPNPGSQPRFVGGGGFDGYATATYSGHVPPVPGGLPRFLGGGGYDGFASAAVLGIPNPLSGDTDFDGVPDWWEMIHYSSLTAADATTDFDGDHKGSLDEYLADTDPKDGASFFDILTFQRTASEIQITSGITSPHRRYWVEATSNLAASWDDVDGVRFPGTGGDLGFAFENVWPDTGYFRVRVALPEVGE